MNAAQEQKLFDTVLEDHGLIKEMYGSHKALIEERKRDRVDIGKNAERIQTIQTNMVTREDYNRIHNSHVEEKRWNWARTSKLILLIFALVNLLLGSGLVVTITRLTATAAVAP